MGIQLSSLGALKLAFSNFITLRAINWTFKSAKIILMVFLKVAPLLDTLKLTKRHINANFSISNEPFNS